MAQPFQFDKAVLQVVADDKQMLATLKKDEAVVNRSVDKMQGKLNKLEVSMKGTGSSAAVATTGVSALGAAASVTGSSTLMLGAQVGTLGMALSLMGKEVTTASTQLGLMTRAAVAFMVTPLGAALTIIAAVAASVALAWKKMSGEVAKAREELEKIEEVVRANEAATDKFVDQIERLKDKLLVARGEMTKNEAAAKALAAAMREQLEGGVAVEALRERMRLEGELADILKQSARAKRREQMDLARAGREEKIRLVTAQERLRVADALANAAEAEARAITAKAGPQNIKEARQLIRDAMELRMQQQRGAFFLRTQFEAMTQRMGISGLELADIAKNLGLDLGKRGASEKPTTRFGAGALAITGFAATGTKGMAQRDPVEQQRTSREEKRTRAAEATATNTERLADAFGRWQPGAA